MELPAEDLYTLHSSKITPRELRVRLGGFVALLRDMMGAAEGSRLRVNTASRALMTAEAVEGPAPGIMVRGTVEGHCNVATTVLLQHRVWMSFSPGAPH